MSGIVKRVAIIGAGAAGIVAAKTASIAGLVPTVFDKSSHIGGVWSPTGLVWSGMHVNLGNHMTSFADFPWSKSSLVFPRGTDVYQYLLSYVKHFGIEERFRLNTKVESVKLLDDERWQITSVCNNQTSADVFDYCIIAIGYNSKARIPEEYQKGKVLFKGEMIHSGEFRVAKDRLKGKKVVVVGGSISAHEISSELVDHAESVSVLLKSKYLVLPKLVRDRMSNGMFKLYPIDALLYSRRFYNCSKRKLVEDDYYVKNICTKLCQVQASMAKSNPAMFVDLENVNFSSQKMSISEDFIDLVQSSKIKTQEGYISAFRPEGIVTNNETFIEADVLIFCTSYQMDLSFLDETTLKILNYNPRYFNDLICLYKNTWHPDLPNMGFVGLVQRAAFIVGELQSKWIFKVFNEELSLPSRAIMMEWISMEAEKRERNLDCQFPYPVQYLCSMLADEVNFYDLEKEKRDNQELYEMLLNGPVLPEHFQLNDPEKREAAIEQIRFVNARYNREFTKQEADAIQVQNFI